MDKLRKVMQRSHYTSLIIGASNVGSTEKWFAEPSFTGWETNFDGGGDRPNPNLYAACFAEAKWAETEDHKDEEPGVESVTVLFCEKSYTYDPADSCRVAVYRHRRPEDLTDKDFSGEAFWEEPRKDSDGSLWEEVPINEVDNYDLNLMRTTIQTMMDLFGQGGDFFDV
ncbi:MAG: hypothetical protein ABIE43_05225 [Patescibacteria group bacterium]